MIKFRPLPTPADTKTNVAVPSTWPQGLNDSELVLAEVTAAWEPWWADLSPGYEAAIASCPLSIRSIAHALHLEITNGWSFEFCLRYCEENLLQTGSELRGSPKIKELTSRARAGVDEQIASAVTIALAAADGYRYLGDLQRYAKKHPDMVCRRWKGNGPDHLVAQIGDSANDHVAIFRFLEAKGNATEFSNAKPRNFFSFKTQSLNADLRFNCAVQPILSYVYLPATGAPLFAQWFNATAEQSTKQPDRARQAFLLLSAAKDQYVRIMWKSRRTGNRVLRRQRLWIISQDRSSAVAIDIDAKITFKKIGSTLRKIRAPEDFDKERKALLDAVEALRQIAKTADELEPRIERFDAIRFNVIARDATGFIFLRRTFN